MTDRHAERLGPFTLTLTPGCFPLGEDSLALGDFASLRPGWRVCDLGCGGGTLLLLLARREPQLTLTGVELDPESAQCARDNLRVNGLNGTVQTGDLRTKGLLPNEGFDLVISNPPYFSPDRGAAGGPARCGEENFLDALCAAANRLLPTGGRFAVVYRPERLCDLLCTLRDHRLEPRRLRLMAHSPNHPPSAVLVEAVKNGGPGMDILPLLVRNGCSN